MVWAIFSLGAPVSSVRKVAVVERFDSLYPRHHQRLVNFFIIIKKLLKCVMQHMEPLAANPLQFRPCFGSTVYSCCFFWTYFWATSGKMMFLGTKSTCRDMDYLGNTDKQTIEIWHDGTIKFSRRKSYLKNDIWLFNFLIIKKSVICVILNESCRAVYGSMDRDITLLNTYRHTFRS